MVEIEGSVVKIGLKAALAGAVAFAVTLVAASFVLWQALVGGVRADIAALRTGLTSESQRVSETRDASGDLKAALASLVAELRVTNESLSGLSRTVSALDVSVRSVDARLTQSIDRQIAFERWIAVKVGGNELTSKTLLPANWQKSENSILPVLTDQPDPIEKWFRLQKAAGGQ